jgi:hypothetical protein
MASNLIGENWIRSRLVDLGRALFPPNRTRGYAHEPGPWRVINSTCTYNPKTGGHTKEDLNKALMPG